MNTVIHMRRDVGSGEGSKGGKVIGRTKTGKPIYMNHGHPSHKDFTFGEHKEAVGLHLKALGKLPLRMEKTHHSSIEGHKLAAVELHKKGLGESK